MLGSCSNYDHYYRFLGWRMNFTITHAILKKISIFSSLVSKYTMPVMRVGVFFDEGLARHAGQVLHDRPIGHHLTCLYLALFSGWLDAARIVVHCDHHTGFWLSKHDRWRDPAEDSLDSRPLNLCSYIESLRGTQTTRSSPILPTAW